MAPRALQEICDTLRPDVPDIQGITDHHLPGIVRCILEEARKPGADPADFSGAVRRALEQARAHIANLEFATAAHVLDAQLAQIDAENRDRARAHAALLAERGPPSCNTVAAVADQANREGPIAAARTAATASIWASVMSGAMGRPSTRGATCSVTARPAGIADAAK